jgi:hypothetical protein
MSPGAIPGPGFSTTNRTGARPAVRPPPAAASGSGTGVSAITADTRTTDPGGENFTAFDRKFVNTWITRS